jgi:multidrug resistance efflux pump
MEEKKGQKIEIRSEEIQDILGQIPSWIVRWGTVVILATVLIILVGSMFVSYPDKKRADILVTTENPPANMVARSSGQIVELFVYDSQFVKINTPLAVIENPADYSDVLSLQYDIEEIKTIIANLDQGEYIPLTNTYTLGEIQSAYAEFINAYENYFQFLDRDYHTQTINSIEEEIRRFQLMNSGLSKQVSIQRREYQLAQRQYVRDSTVHAKGAISDKEVDVSEQNKLSVELKYEQSRQEKESNQIEISKLEQNILNLQLTARKEREQMETVVREAFEKLIGQIDMWEQKFLLNARIDGVVSFTNIYTETQNVLEGDIVMTIIPDNPGEIIGKIRLPIEGSGKVKINQTVNIQFADFPHLEYGMVKGVIRSISQVPEDQQYVLEVDLADSLVTYYNIPIPFRQEMMGRAEIITDDRVLIKRIFSPIRSAISEQKETRRGSETKSQSE